MLKAKVLIPALLLSAVTFGPVSAAPGLHPGVDQVTPMQMKVVERDRYYGDRGDRDRFGDRDYRRGDRYYGRGYARRGPPPGWHRFGYRPNDWRTRGCLEIGPAWFCP